MSKTYKTNIYNQYQISIAIGELKQAMYNLQDYLKYMEDIDALEKDITNSELMQKVANTCDYIKELQQNIDEAYDTVESWHYNELAKKEDITED